MFNTDGMEKLKTKLKKKILTEIGQLEETMLEDYKLKQK